MQFALEIKSSRLAPREVARPTEIATDWTFDRKGKPTNTAGSSVFRVGDLSAWPQLNGVLQEQAYNSWLLDKQHQPRRALARLPLAGPVFLSLTFVRYNKILCPSPFDPSPMFGINDGS